jgi:hypothetical protein
VFLLWLDLTTVCSILTLKMLFGRLGVCGDVMWMVVSHVEGEAGPVSRFILTVKRGNVYLNLGASYERGYPVVKGKCFISEHDERGDEVIPQYCVEEGMIIEDLLCFLNLWSVGLVKFGMIGRMLREDGGIYRKRVAVWKRMD